MPCSTQHRRSFTHSHECSSHGNCQILTQADAAGGEVEQILEGVTQWVSSMIDDNADSFGEYESVQQGGDISSITAHVATVISQMAGSLAGPNEDMDVEITYEFDLGVS